MRKKFHVIDKRYYLPLGLSGFFLYAALNEFIRGRVVTGLALFLFFLMFIYVGFICAFRPRPQQTVTLDFSRRKVVFENFLIGQRTLRIMVMPIFRQQIHDRYECSFDEIRGVRYGITPPRSLMGNQYIEVSTPRGYTYIEFPVTEPAELFKELRTICPHLDPDVRSEWLISIVLMIFAAAFIWFGVQWATDPSFEKSVRNRVLGIFHPG